MTQHSAAPIRLRDDRMPLLSAASVAALSAFVLIVLFPYFVGRVISLPYATFAVLWVYAVTALLRREGVTVKLALLITIPALTLLASYYFFALPDILTQSFGVLPAVIRAYLLVPPVAVVAGLLLLRDPLLPVFLRVLRIGAAALAVLAVVEYLRGSFLLPGNVSEIGLRKFQTVGGDGLTGGGGIRALVATEHPLVLATLLAAALPVALWGRRSPLRLAEAGLLLLGIYATGSTGPLVLGVLCIALAVFTPRRLRGADAVPRTLAAWALGVVFAVFAVLSVLVWEPVVDERSGADASTQYRFALFAMIPRIIAEHPFGFGIGQVPEGQLLIQHDGPVLDVATTVDSELVLLVIQFGLLGVAVFAAIVWVAVRGLLGGPDGRLLAAMLVMSTACGLFLSLHTWSALAPFWEVLIGAGIAAISSPRKGDEYPPRRRGQLTQESTISPVDSPAIPSIR